MAPAMPASVLAIETSCDETAFAILRGNELLSSQVASQTELHAQYGGVVPEVASRNHLLQLRPLLERTRLSAGIGIDQIDAFAATCGPGLATSLMIGASLAKGLAVSLRKPFIAINHLEGHLLSPFFGREIEPSIALIVSGGHTLLVEIEDYGKYRVLGQTCDDAAGEAFDKVGKLLGLPYPGGPQIDQHARLGDPARFDFPRSMLGSGDANFSFSGLKTSVRYLLPKLKGGDWLNDLCASFQEAVVDVLIQKTILAAKARGQRVVAVSGGVSCNTRLRERFQTACTEESFTLLLAKPALCTDNAAMIAFVAVQKLERNEISALTCEIDPNFQLTIPESALAC